LVRGFEDFTVLAGGIEAGGFAFSLGNHIPTMKATSVATKLRKEMIGAFLAKKEALPE
jgi:hypothetical protein